MKEKYRIITHYQIVKFDAFTLSLGFGVRLKLAWLNTSYWKAQKKSISSTIFQEQTTSTLRYAGKNKIHHNIYQVSSSKKTRHQSKTKLKQCVHWPHSVLIDFYVLIGGQSVATDNYDEIQRPWYKEQNIYNFLLTHKATVLKEYRVSKNYVNNFEVPFK